MACTVGKTTEIVFLIDSGAAINTITEGMWRKLYLDNAEIHKRNYDCNRILKAYASESPLRVVAVFVAEISISDLKPKCCDEFFVVKGATKSLLSKRTAEYLKVLKVGLSVQSVEACKTFPMFPNVQVKLSIDESVPPRKLSYYRVPAPMEDRVNAKLDQLMEEGIIERAEGPPDWISPMVVVPKGKDDVRLCINMKLPNEAIKREHYPLPTIETFLNKLRGARWFSKLDLKLGFHHVELHPDSRHITTFMSGKGLMRYTRLMFGINCAPEIFQRIMTEMLTGVEGVIVFIDDIVVFGCTKFQHDERLKEVLSVLKQNRATLNKEKCKFGVTEIEILGFKVDCEGVTPTDEKIKALKNFRMPVTKEEARSFLGLITFVGHFIPDLSTRADPLRRFIRGDVATFGNEQEKAFNDLRETLASSVLKLGHYNPKDTTEVYVDASPVGLGAALVQRSASDKPRIIFLASKSLTATEKVYPQTQREALAVVWAVERFYLYLFGLHFTVFSDHKTLEYLYRGKYQDGRRACSRAEGWALRLQPYDFDIKHIGGKSNIADTLSRLCLQTDEAFDESSEFGLCAIGEGEAAISVSEIKAETEQDATLQEVIAALKNQDWPPTLIQYQALHKELGVTDGVLVRNERATLPTKLRSRALKIAHSGHPGKVGMKRILREKVWWPGMDRDVEKEADDCLGCRAVSKMDPPEPMHRRDLPERAWQEIAVDFFSVADYPTLLIVVDYFSRFVEVIEMKGGTSASKTAEALDSVFERHYLPEVIQCDNGQPFPSEELETFCKKRAIKRVMTVPYWPQMNGEVERQNRGILRALKIAKVEKKPWRSALKDYLTMYNTTPHTVTGKSPFELMMGRQPKLLIPSLLNPPHQMYEEVRERDATEKLKGKLYADKRRHAKESEIQVGDKVMLKNFKQGKIESNFTPAPFTVISRDGSDTLVQNEEGVRYRRHLSHLKKWPIEERAEFPNVPRETNKEEVPNRKRGHETAFEPTSRPVRIKKAPERYQAQVE